MEKLKQLWNGFASKHPKISKWVREGGLFIIVSNLITVLKMLCLMFLPMAFWFLGNVEFGFPGIQANLFGIDFKWYIIGYSTEDGGLAYFTAYMIAMFVFEVINFFIQRKFVFRSDGNIYYQGAWYLLAFCVITCVVNSINCYWKAVITDPGVIDFLGAELANLFEAMGTTVMNGGVSMVIFFFVNKIIFPEGEASKKAVEALDTEKTEEEESV